jgi:hypothetical protein
MKALTVVLGVQCLASTLLAQSREACVPLDSTPVVEWHRQWDDVSLDSLHKLATNSEPQSGIIEVKGWTGGSPGGNPARVHRTYEITAFLLNQGGPDLTWKGMVWFGSPSQGLLERYASNEYLHRGPLLQGVLWGKELVGAISAEADSVPLEAIISPEGQLEFGTGFYTMDGGWFTAVEWTEKSLRGWWYPSGAVVPEQLGYFCAYAL